MYSGQDPYTRDKKPSSLVIMTGALVMILGVSLLLIFKYKPENHKSDTENKAVVYSPSDEYLSSVEKSILQVSDLTVQMYLLDGLFDELVYTESPEEERIKQFVANYKDYASVFGRDKLFLNSTAWLSKERDSSALSFDKQIEYIDNSIAILLESIDKKKKFLNTIPIALPVDQKDAQIVSGFGMRDHPVLDEPRFHAGIDIKAPVGTIVVATASGRVLSTEEQMGSGYGRPCLIEHKFGYQTLYGHLVRLEVYKNKIVQKGDIIGRVGDTGLSQGPHLHYEVRKSGRNLNPSFFLFEGLTDSEYREIIKLGTQ